MDGLWEKISSYNIFNNLFPGALYVYFLERSSGLVISSEDVIKNVMLYYFVGLLLSRIGSLFIEPMIKLVRIVKFVPYNEYISACAKDAKIETLQEVANMYRTMFAMFILLWASIFLVGILNGVDYKVTKYIYLALAFIFIISYRKQVGFIVKRCNKANDRLP